MGGRAWSSPRVTTELNTIEINSFEEMTASEEVHYILTELSPLYKVHPLQAPPLGVSQARVLGCQSFSV